MNTRTLMKQLAAVGMAAAAVGVAAGAVQAAPATKTIRVLSVKEALLNFEWVKRHGG